MAKTIVQRFAARVLSLRTEKRLTQEELAGRAGLHPRYISAIEGSRQVPSLTTIAQLAKGLEVDLATLVSVDRDEKAKAGKVGAEIDTINRRLRSASLSTVMKIRKIVEVLASR